MPDEITLLDVYEKQIKLEVLVLQLMQAISPNSSAIIKVEEPSPFLDPETGLYSYRYYQQEQLKREEDK